MYYSYNLEIRGNRRKRISDSESASKNTLAKEIKFFLERYLNSSNTAKFDVRHDVLCW